MIIMFASHSVELKIAIAVAILYAALFFQEKMYFQNTSLFPLFNFNSTSGITIRRCNDHFYSFLLSIQ